MTETEINDFLADVARVTQEVWDLTKRAEHESGALVTCIAHLEEAHAILADLPRDLDADVVAEYHSAQPSLPPQPAGMPIVRFTGDDILDTIVNCLRSLTGYVVGLPEYGDVMLTSVDHDGLRFRRYDSNSGDVFGPVVCKPWTEVYDIEVY